MQEPYEIEWKDYYKILNVTINATPEEIKKNYRDLAKYYHPDNNPNNLEAEAKFKEINEAYMILGDKNRRQKYDYFYKNIYKNEQSIKNEQNTRFNPYENLNNAFLLTMKLYVLEGQLTNHKAKQAIGSGLTVSGIAGLLMQILNYLDIVKNKEEISKVFLIFTFIYSVLLSSGLYTLYKESKFDTIEHLQKMSELEQELRRTLRF